MTGPSPRSWLRTTPSGLYCAPADAYIDPSIPVARAVITHGHGDHARSGHGAVLATPDTIAIMKTRYGEGCAGSFQALPYGSELRMGDVSLRLAPAGHILGSAQVVMEHGGRRAVVSGDYKRASDPTCAPFELVPCDLFVTEATFALPVFRHEPAEAEVARLLASLEGQPERVHLVGAYGLGKCQRVIKLLRLAGYEQPIHLHGAMVALCRLYADLGVDLGPLNTLGEGKAALGTGAVVMCPPSALADRWSRRFEDPVRAFASGWMRIKGRARQRGVELPLVISDHADWPELVRTIEQTEAEEVWITHGRDDALTHYLAGRGVKASALSLVGREDEGEDG